MAELVTLEQHMDRQPPTVVIQATDCLEAVLALVKLQEDGLGVHLPVQVSCLLQMQLHCDECTQTLFELLGSIHVAT